MKELCILNIGNFYVVYLILSTFLFWLAKGWVCGPQYTQTQIGWEVNCLAHLDCNEEINALSDIDREYTMCILIMAQLHLVLG